jgi:hypothetical protein
MEETDTNIHVTIAIHFSPKEKIVKNYLYLSKLAAQMVTSTPSENLSLHLYEAQNKNFKFGTTRTLILHARSIFFKGSQSPNKNMEEKHIFHVNPGALTVSVTLQVCLSGRTEIHLQTGGGGGGWRKACARRRDCCKKSLMVKYNYHIFMCFVVHVYN